MSAVGDIIQPGESIPPDVIGWKDKEGDEMHRMPEGWWCCNVDAPHTCTQHADEEVLKYAPLTVTAVREPAEPERYTPLTFITCGTCGQRSMHSHYCGEEEPAQPAEPEPAEPVHYYFTELRTGAVALVTRNQDGDEVRFVPAPKQPGSWVMASGAPTGDWLLVEILRAFDGSVSVVMREPRTWEALEPAPKDLKLFKGASGEVYMPWTTLGGELTGEYLPKSKYDAGEKMLSFVTHRLSHWREVDGPLVEVFDDEDGTR